MLRQRSVFFKRVLPYAAMFHLPTFHHRLYLDRVSPLLLECIYALASRFCEQPTFLSAFPPETPVFTRVDEFAERAHRCARQAVDPGTWEETECAQALLLLSVYFSAASHRQIPLGKLYLDAALGVLRPTSCATLPPPSSELGLGTVEYLTLMEARHRTFWMIMMQDSSSAADGRGRPRRALDEEVCNIPLPGGEAGWTRWGGGGREMGRRDGMVAGSGNSVGEDSAVGEFGHLLRMVRPSLLRKPRGNDLMGRASRPCSRTS